MKKMLLSAITVALLTACSVVPPLHQAQSLNAKADHIANQVKKSENRIIAYYNADGKKVAHATVGGFYRILLGRTAEGKAVVQDFYQDSKTKQTNVMLIPDDINLNSFDAEVAEGRIIWYSPQGEIMQFADINNGHTLAHGDYLNGRLVQEFKFNPDTKGESMAAYHENGKLLISQKKSSPAADLIIQFYREDGTLLWDNSQKSLTELSEADSKEMLAIWAHHLKRTQQLNQQK